MTITAEDGTEYAAPAVYNAFPARVVDPNGRQYSGDIRAVVIPDELFVYGERTDQWGHRVPVTMLRVPLARMRPDGNSWIVTDLDGLEWQVGPGSGCGCGSPLRSMDTPPLANYPATDQ